MSERFANIAKILMGAALADEDLDGRELETVRELLCSAMSVDELPGELERSLHLFDNDEFDVEETVEAIGLVDKPMKLKLLELIVAVHESDDVWDLHEDEYLRSVAKALDLSPEDYANMTMEISIEEAGKVLKPPPLPPKKK